MKKKVIITILFVKVSIVVFIFLAFSLLPFNYDTYSGNFVYPPHSPITLKTAYATWDAQHYIYVSEKGYQKGNDSDAFSPLFPFLIHIFTFLTRNSFWSGIVLSNIFSFVACYLFYLLVKSRASEKIAYISLLFLLAFPTSFYFSLIYTESLFFLLVILFFIFLQKRQIFLAAAIAFFLPLTRLIGVAILLPFLTSYILEYQGHSLYDEMVIITKSLFSKETWYLLSPIGGLFVGMLIMYLTTGSWWTQFAIQQNFISHYSLFNIVNPLIFFRTLFDFPLQIHGFTNSLLDRLFFLWFICLTPFVAKRVSKSFFVYTVVFGLLPVLSGSFMSYMRYLLVLFPLFITLGKMSQEKKYTNWTFPFLLFSIMMQSLFLIMHTLNYWLA